MSPNNIGLTVLRSMVAIIFITHSIYRALIGQTVSGFGEFLEASLHIPFGILVAWSVTVYEFVGGFLLVANRYSRYISGGFILHQIMGIALVHFKNGWFVVGAGNGGVEYSLLIIASLIAIALNSPSKK